MSRERERERVKREGSEGTSGKTRKKRGMVRKGERGVEKRENGEAERGKMKESERVRGNLVCKSFQA